MINLKKLKRLYKGANRYKWKTFPYTMMETVEMTGISSNWKHDKSRFSICQTIMNNKKADMDLIAFLHNNCEEIIQALEERDDKRNRTNTKTN